MFSVKELLSIDLLENKFFIPSTDDQLLFAKYINALLNSEYGGTIYIGINQKQKVQGVFPSYELIAIEKIISEFNIKNIDFLSEIIEIDKKLIIKLVIKGASVKPQYLKFLESKEVYIIHQSKLIKANHIIEKALKFKVVNGNPPQVLSNEESEIKKHIELKTNISLNNLYKVSSLPKKTIDFVLVRLLNWNKINFNILDGSCYFTSI